MLKSIATALGLLLAGGAPAPDVAPPRPTLAPVRARGAPSRGTPTGDPAWSAPDSRGEWQGMDADVCRAIAAATLGDAKKLVWQHLTGQNRFPAVVTGQV